MSDRIPIHALDTTGADSTNDTPRYNPATDRLEFAPGGSGSGGTSTGELLMQDGVTSPPVPLETEARDDYLYEG